MSVESYVVFAVFITKVAYEEKSDKLTDFGSVKAAHSHVEHVGVIFLGPFLAMHNYVDVSVTEKFV